MGLLERASTGPATESQEGTSLTSELAALSIEEDLCKPRIGGMGKFDNSKGQRGSSTGTGGKSVTGGTTSVVHDLLQTRRV